MEECGVVSVAAEFMVGSRFSSRCDGEARVLRIAAHYTPTTTIPVRCPSHYCLAFAFVHQHKHVQMTEEQAVRLERPR
jgi:hypothetical protein